MTIFGIIILIVLGILLLLIEFLVIPGVTIAGIGGLILIGAGVYLSYSTYGTPIGHYTLIATVAFVFLSIGIALKSKTWKNFSLNTAIDGKVVNISNEDNIQAGDTGVAISRLSPHGKVLIKNKYFEAKSNAGYIDENTTIVVIKTSDNTIIVDEAKNQA